MDALDELLKEKRSELSDLKRKLKKLKKESNHTEISKVERAINYLEAYLQRFKKSNMEPKKIGDIVINYKLYERFMKKLNGFQVHQEIKDNQLIVTYENKTSKGTFTLEDISLHFSDVSKIQEGELHAIL